MPLRQRSPPDRREKVSDQAPDSSPLFPPTEETTPLTMKTIGTWRETRVHSGRDSGLSLEAVDVPHDHPRAAAVRSAAVWEDTQTKPLARGETGEMETDPEDLCARIDQCVE